MAKVIIVGTSKRKLGWCPQCRRRIKQELILDRGVKCDRCGVIEWEAFDKYPSLDNVPVPDKDVKDIPKAIKKVQNDNRVDTRPQPKTNTHGGSRKNQPIGNRSKPLPSKRVDPEVADKPKTDK